MTTFEDVKEKFEKADKYMALNTTLALDDNFPAHATWINPPTLARWFYGSSKEWISDYKATAAQLQNKSEFEEAQINIWQGILEGRLNNMNPKLGQKYPQDSLLMEALKQ